MLIDRRRLTFLAAGPIFGGLVWWLCASAGLASPACWCAFTASVCAVWWVVEALPLPATALLPFVVFPLTGVLDHRAVASNYGHTAILLMMGGFFLSAAMERSGVHRRIAMVLVSAIGGGSAGRLVLGFMLATALLSMWISNTATALMMLPIALAVLQQAQSPGLRTALLLGIAYAASIGGMGTPIGTPPNVLFIANYAEQTGETIGFVEWARIALPIVLLIFPAAWFVITRGVRLQRPVVMPPVGRWRPSERRVLAVFFLTAAAWVFREWPDGGWAGLVGAVDSSGNTMVGDATVALAGALLLFLVPSGERPEVEPTAGEQAGEEREARKTGELGSEALLDWETATRVPWGVLVLFGGGLAIAAGFQETGLSEQIGASLVVLQTLPPLLIIGGVCVLVNLLTELTSSTATTALLLPILAETARAAGLPLEVVMIPGTISASCAFMLPVATPPNTIVFAAGGLTATEMARRGAALNLYAAVVITLVGYWLLG
ncbi:SLC13 family permease [Candidatus Laterigemmans baculatus]|uniref:SLC13 family permease n=1 Tax=Candidatus Laterigemmans baculatus TaxID=2770505 RepID=UPI0013DB45F9|nr:SLC13 family permease [Candidatus Laterigemmans baculatus]